MVTSKEIELAKKETVNMLEKQYIVLTPAERSAIEIVDCGLRDIQKIGAEIVVYVNNDRYCAKELVLMPRQSCPEHRHPPFGSDPGKMETFRCRSGKVWLYVEGEPTPNPHCLPPQEYETYFTVFHEIELNPGDQYTIGPNTLHWFQSGDDGAIVSEFSSACRDEFDIFTDPHIHRV